MQTIKDIVDSTGCKFCTYKRTPCADGIHYSAVIYCNKKLECINVEACVRCKLKEGPGHEELHR